MSEAAVQAEVRLECARRGVLLWRNNTGVLPDETGRPVRFGLNNDNPALNKICKSSDLVGIGPGGKFWALEIKHAGWKYSGNPREKAQKAFIDLVLARGGVAAFVTCVGDIP